LAALLLPAIQAAREAARRTQCVNNLKQIGVAFHNYHEVYGTFPPAYIPDKDGNPMHSWRVLILPFMEQQALYNKYNFDEPWDSPGNLAVTNTVIPVYSCPSCPPSGGTTGSTETNYMVITGPGTVFDGAKAASMADIKDGSSNTIMVVEVTGTGVGWAEPVDLDATNMQFPNTTPGSTGPDSYHPGGFNAALCDGSTHFFSDSISRETFDALITKAGAEQVGNY
jgi:prepilin-type processing-associated H-X9-DG protein